MDDVGGADKSVRATRADEQRYTSGGLGISFYHALAAIGFGTGVGHLVTLAIETDDEHGASVALADGLIGRQGWRLSAPGSGIADAFAEGAMAEFIGAAKEFDGIVGVVGSYGGLHGTEMLVAKGKDIRPHAKRV